jgi:hypothetical protein
MSVLIEIFLPLADNDGNSFDRSLFTTLESELAAKFGGVTSFMRAPAHGISQGNGKKARDDIVVMEIMTEMLDRDWWKGYRKELEARFRQDEILIRVSQIEKL